MYQTFYTERKMKENLFSFLVPKSSRHFELGNEIWKVINMAREWDKEKTFVDLWQQSNPWPPEH